eukprot:79902_1
MSSFERLGVIPEIISATQKLDWLLPTPVQDEAIPLILGGGDVMVAAETGSGKTAAFGIPIIQTVYETLRGEGGTASSSASTKHASDESIGAIKLSPTCADKLFQTDGLKGSSSSNAWHGGRANLGVIGGRYYYELNVIYGGLRVGWCTVASTGYGCGTDNQSWGFGYTAKKAHGGNFIPYGQRFGDGDFIGCYIDFPRREISFSVNGRSCGVAFDQIPNMGNSPVYPCVIVKNGSVKFNFGSAPFHSKPRTGFVALQNAKWKQSSAYFRELAAQNEQRENRKNRNVATPLAVILAPTRDLATQIHADIGKLKIFCSEPAIHCCLCIGGVSKMMSDVLRAHILVGSMGCVIGLIKSHKLTLSCCKFFILDEADRVLDPKQGNQSDVLAMYSRLSAGVQVMLFSATLHSDPIREMSKKICHEPMWVDLKGKDFVPDTVHHCILVVDPIKDRQWTARNSVNQSITTDGVHRRDQIQWNPNNRTQLSDKTKSEGIKLLKPLILKKIIDSFKMDQCLVFCRTRLDCDNIVDFLTKIGGGRKFNAASTGGKENPYSCIALHSGVRQHQRADNLKLFKDGFVRFLVCTDVAARGIDIKSLPYVINVTMPAEDEDYVHRVGRVGRADQAGIAISIISSQKEKVWYHSNCPDRGKNCTNTNLTTQGGCCIWYDEVKIFEAVEKRLGGNPIPILDQNKHLNSKGKIMDFIKTIEAKDPLIASSEKKYKKLLPTIEQLNHLEVIAQNEYLHIPLKFANVFGKDGNVKVMHSKKKKKVHRAGKKKSRGGRKKKKQPAGPARG